MIVLLTPLPPVAIALLAQWQVQRMHHRYSPTPAIFSRTDAGIHDVEIVEHD